MQGRLGTFQKHPAFGGANFNTIQDLVGSSSILYYASSIPQPAGTPNLLPMCTKSTLSHSVRHCVEHPHHHHQHTRTHVHTKKTKLPWSKLLHESHTPAKQSLLSTQRTLALDSHITSKDALTIICHVGINYDLTLLHSSLLPLYYSGVGTLFWGHFLMFCAPFKYQPPHI